MTLTELGRAVQCSSGHLSRIENHLSIPNGDILVRIDMHFAELRKRRRLPASVRVDWTYLAELREEGATVKRVDGRSLGLNERMERLRAQGCDSA